MTASKSTAVATKEEAALPAVPEELLEQFQTHAGEGAEAIKNADKAIPFLGLVQSLSPQRKKDNPKYINGAEEGDMFDSVTRALFKGSEGMLVIPVDFQKVYNVWIPRDQGGGFLGSFADPACQQPLTAIVRNTAYDGPTQTVPTANHFVLVLTPEGLWQPALLSMKSTQLTVSRQWCTRMSMVFITAKDGTRVPAPTFAKQYRIRSVVAKNDKGEYYNYLIEDAGFIPPDVFPQALEFRQSLKAGRVAVDYTKDETAGDTTAGGPAAETKEDKDLPF